MNRSKTFLIFLSFVEYIINKMIDIYVSVIKLFQEYSYDNAVLIIQMGGIGDYVLFTATLPGYRQLFHGKKIVLIGRDQLISLVDKSPCVDHFISVDYGKFKRTLKEKLRIAKALTAFNFGYCINASYSTIHERIECPIVLWSGAKEKVAFKCLDRGAQRNYLIYTDVVQQKSELLFEIDRNNELIRHLGLSKYDDHKTTIWGIDKTSIEQTLDKFKLSRNYCVIFPGSSNSMKNWDPNNYSAVIKRIHYESMNVIFCGSKSDDIVTNRIINSISKITTTNLTDKTSVFELAVIVSQSNFVIANDTAVVHIAGALNVPCIAIVGGGHIGRFLPYPYTSSINTVSIPNALDCFGCDWRRCVHSSVRCIDEINPEQVIAKFYDMVNHQLIRI